MVRIIKRDFALIDSENHSSFNKSTKKHFKLDRLNLL